MKKIVTLVLIFVLISTTNSIAKSWWNISWTKRRKITFDNSSQSENLVNFPILVKLDSTRINYVNTQDAGQDIRFVDSDDATLLKHEIEKWDESSTSIVWVKVPQIDGSSNTDFIWMYYGNASVADGQDAVNVWDGNYMMVQHMSEDPSGTAPQMLDSTVNNNDGTSGGTMTSEDQVAGQVDGSLDFDGVNDYVLTSFSPDFTGLTFSVWVKPADVSSIVLGRLNSSWTDAANGVFVFDVLSSSHPNYPQTFIVYGNQGGAEGYKFRSSPVMTYNEWQHLVVTWDGTKWRGYRNGVRADDDSWSNSGSFSGTTDDISIGGRELNTDYRFNGLIDDVRISSSARSADWIAASYSSQNDTFASFGAEQWVDNAIFFGLGF